VVNQFPPLDRPEAGSCRTGGVIVDVPNGPDCPGFSEFTQRSLDAGSLQVRGSAKTFTVAPVVQEDHIRYDAALPAGILGPWLVSLSGWGGHDVGSFDTTFQLGSPIQVSTPFPPGTAIDRCQPLRVAWTGGDRNSIVRVRLISHMPPDAKLRPGDLETYLECAAPASAGFVELPTYPNGGEWCPDYIPVNPGKNLELIVSVGPQNEVTTTPAGLTKGLRTTWRYDYRFGGLRM